MSEQLERSWRIVALSITATVLSACGGSEGVGKCYSPTVPICERLGVEISQPTVTPPTSPAAGLYRGVTSNGRSFAGLVLDDNSFYSIYSSINNPNIAAGGIQGTVRTNSGGYTITDAVDVNLEGLGARIATVSGSFAQKQSINGTVSYPSGGQSVSFTANYSTDYEAPASIAALAGTYSGSAGSTIGSERVTMQINGAGALSGRANSGCQFSGTVAPRASGNVYQAAITFGPAPCRFAGASASGPAYFDRAAGLVYSILSVSGTNDKFIGIGAKQ